MFTYCADCIYWRAAERTDSYGQCQRHAPRPVQNTDQTTLVFWPRTNDVEGCGEGKPSAHRPAKKR